MKLSAGLAGGIAGTITVASLHEGLKRITPDAPRMDLLDIELIRKGLQLAHQEIPETRELERWAVGGELICDTAYYSLVAIGRKKEVWTRGALLGLFAGITAVILPGPLGLSKEPSNKTTATQLMTIGLYLAGGIVAAAITKLVDSTQPNIDY